MNIWREICESPFVYLQGKIKVMKNIIKKYNSSFEFKAITDSILFVTMLYIGWLGVKFVILNIA